ncbi:MAG TPA: AraC family transcriptional regulator [Sulfurovum sp.]|nr:AraC family transcriptional regulator [Sulfurovum sp.]
MKTTQVKSKTITGLQVRTKNEDEMNPEVAKIGALWQNFFANIMPTLGETPPPLYGVYSNYESDAHGEFDVLVGAEEVVQTKERASVTLKESKYLCFKAKGELPQSVIETWGEIWAYFSDENCKDVRVYKTDFEKYISRDEAEIYIGVE